MSIPVKALTIYEVASLETAFATQIQSSESLKLDLSELEELDSAGVQWLLSLQARKAKLGSAVYLANMSDLAQETLNRLGLSTLLGAESQGEKNA